MTYKFNGQPRKMSSSGRLKEDYRGHRRNEFKNDWQGIPVDHTVQHPPMIRRISDRGEIHYVADREQT